MLCNLSVTRAALLVCTLLAGIATADEISTPINLSPTHANGDRYMSVRILGGLKLSRKADGGQKLRELSGLAWDTDQQLLYAVSDNGYLVHFRPTFADGILRSVALMAIHWLRDADGNLLDKSATDSEGLDIINHRNGVQGDSELIVSFEGDPRIIRYRPNGAFVERYRLPTGLNDIKDYRSDNSGLEGVMLHPKLGMLMAPEKPLSSSNQQVFTIYGLNKDHWQFEPMDREHSSLVDIEAGPDGSILVLERTFINIFKPVIFAVRRLSVDGKKNGKVPVEDLFVLRTDEDWLLDNFEGLAHHENNRYFMVSDDEGNIIQKTLLVYFEILEQNQSATAANR